MFEFVKHEKGESERVAFEEEDEMRIEANRCCDVAVVTLTVAIT